MSDTDTPYAYGHVRAPMTAQENRDAGAILQAWRRIVALVGADHPLPLSPASVVDRVATLTERTAAPPAGAAYAPDAGGDLRVWLDVEIADAERRAPRGSTEMTRALEMTAAKLREVRDRLPAPDPAPARLPPGQRLTVGHLTTRPMRISPEIEAAAEAEWTEVQRAMRPFDAITDSAPIPDDPEGAEETVTARDAVDMWDGAVAPGGYVCGECGHPVETEPCADHQPDAYARMSAPDDPEGAEAVELAPGSATAREVGPAAGGAS